MSRVMRTGWWALVAMMLAPAVLAQSCPNRPIRIVVPFTPGSGSDVLGRMIAPKLADAFRQHVIVDNRAGAGSTLGTALVGAATPDDHTVLVTSSGFAGSASTESRGDFVLNQRAYHDAAILVARENFGSGSSREAALYALVDSGVR